MLISMPTCNSTIFGDFQDILPSFFSVSPILVHRSFRSLLIHTNRQRLQPID